MKKYFSIQFSFVNKLIKIKLLLMIKLSFVNEFHLGKLALSGVTTLEERKSLCLFSKVIYEQFFSSYLIFKTTYNSLLFKFE